MKKIYLYVLEPQEIIDAFAKEGIKIKNVDYDMGELVYDVVEGKKKYEEIKKKEPYFFDSYIVSKGLFNDSDAGSLICAGGDGWYPADFSFSPFKDEES